MKKKIGLIMSMVLLFVFVFSGINNTYVAHAEENNKFVIGTNNLNNTPKNSAKVGDVLKDPEVGWKRYDDKNSNLTYLNGYKADNSPYWNGTSTVMKNGGEAKFNFTGNKLRIISYKSDTQSILTLYIDGNYIGDFNAYKDGDYSVKVLAFDVSNLQNGEHYAILKYSGTNKMISLDAIDIDENSELKPYKEKQAVKAESITLDKTSMELLEGSSDKLNAKVLPEDATNKKVVWTSSDEKIATVDKDGKVTAIKEGKATITAKVEGTDLTATCKVNVTKKVEENKNNAILSISLVNGATKEYDVSMQEVEKFINWFEERSNGKGPSLYSFNKKINPYKTVKEYIVHDKIASFEVREYEGTNK
ncbi:Ig-like domain-containing protein [Clostridium sporogenes]|uniref:Ig-like domain-containing protein n=1 Tax=Clostridium sporogenes TaxID=1509 RepID=UPI0013D65A06|nr:Ig-like domain-containing protein [Clostridium sporogenes]MCW6123181.1 Ig-like domain-containing protein [Clostridium sporogenes]NFT28631.1 Ig domain-containing protein [Clostridium sporogenes]